MTTAGRALPAAVQVEVGPFPVLDEPCGDLVDRIVRLSVQATSRPLLAFALHVGGLNSRRDRDFVAAMRRADVVYADGGSVVWLARRSGARRIERAATTDIGWDILRGLAAITGRPPRVALIGGPPGLAQAAGEVLTDAGVARIVLAEHGYHEDWSGPLAALRAARPEVTVVGLGAPREMVWCTRNVDELAPGLVLTCGGWFGHLVGDERRAPRVLRRPGLEWIARVAQQPTRLGPRYVRGLASTAALAVETGRRRKRRSA